MSTVGAFPGLNAMRRRTIRAEVNPMDKSTVVSIFPKEINEVKHTIQPGRFHIDAGTYDNPAILVVGPSSWWREIDEEQPLLEIPNSSIQVADSIVKDFSNGLLGYSSGSTGPGLFYIAGELTVQKIKTEHKAMLDKYKAIQDRWFEAIVKITDSLWARTNGNPLCVPDDARLAAKMLGLDRDWIKNFKAIDQVKCVACGAMRNPDFPICQVCKAIADPVKAEKLGIKFAL